MAANKRQHTLQAAYLAGFSPAAFAKKRPPMRDLPIWILDVDNLEIRKKSVGNTSVESYRYSFARQDGSYDHAVDEAFQRIETRFTPFMNRVLRAIEQCNIGGQPGPLPEDDHTFICNYLYMYAVRTPRIFDWIRSSSRDHTMETSHRHGDEFDPDYAQYLSLRTLAHVTSENGEQFMRLLYDRTTTIEYIPRSRNSFITTDNPVVIENPAGPNGLAYEETEVLFPLNQFILLRLEKPGNRLQIRKYHDPSAADRLNTVLLSRSTRIAVGRDPQQLQDLAESVGLEATIRIPSDKKTESR